MLDLRGLVAGKKTHPPCDFSDLMRLTIWFFFPFYSPESTQRACWAGLWRGRISPCTHGVRHNKSDCIARVIVLVNCKGLSACYACFVAFCVCLCLRVWCEFVHEWMMFDEWICVAVYVCTCGFVFVWVYMLKRARGMPCYSEIKHKACHGTSKPRFDVVPKLKHSIARWTVN